jgi:hypothetical protein
VVSWEEATDEAVHFTHRGGVGRLPVTLFTLRIVVEGCR